MFVSDCDEEFFITSQSGETDTFEPSPAWPVGMVLKIFAVDSECRKFFNIPLLIGGATTSKIHTAVKIADKYLGPTLHVVDASRSVPIVNNLVSEEKKTTIINDYKIEYDRLREKHFNKDVKKLATLEVARNNYLKIST